MALSGGCHCGAVRYEIEGEALHRALCHCTDCRRAAGAPLVAWGMFPEEAVKVVKGAAKVYESSADGRRHFCADCGAGLFFVNSVVLPGMIDVQIATLDDPAALPPSVHIQTADRISWSKTMHELPEFERFPPME